MAQQQQTEPPTTIFSRASTMNISKSDIHSRPCGMGMEVVVNEAWNFLLDTKPLFWSDGLG
jgi:hypothetical protein